MKKFEVPYNFDPACLKLYGRPEYRDLVDCVFMAPFRGDYEGAKRYYNHESLTAITLEPEDRATYEKHVRRIVKAGFAPMVLLQNRQDKCTPELLSYYVRLGFRRFAVTNDDTARRIKDRDPSFEVVASITKKLSLEQYHTLDLSMYDKFVLYFPFNRSRRSVALLPRKYRYVMLVNCDCSVLCPGEGHWFAGCDENGRETSTLQCRSGKMIETIRVLPEHLHIFDEWIDTYKLQGREFPTTQLEEDLASYLPRKNLEGIMKKYDAWLDQRYGEALFYDDLDPAKNRFLRPPGVQAPVEPEPAELRTASRLMHIRRPAPTGR